MEEVKRFFSLAIGGITGRGMGGRGLMQARSLGGGAQDVYLTGNGGGRGRSLSGK